MKNLVKPILLIILVAVFATLIVLPSNLNADVLMQGDKMVINDIDTCRCPGGSGNCQCLVIKPSVN